MTHIEAKAANLALGGPSETSVEAEAALSPEALALFSSLFAQMQPEIIAAADNRSQPPDSAVTWSTESTAMPLGITVSQQDIVGTKILDAGVIDAGVIDAGAIDAGAIDVGGIANLTELLIAAQQIVGNGQVAAETPATAIEKTIFSDSPMTETTNITTQVMREAAVALIARKQRIAATESSAPKTAYDSEALSNPQLRALIHATMRPVLKDMVLHGQTIDAAPTAAPEAFTGFDPRVATSSALKLPLVDAVPNALQGPPQPSGQGPVPVQLANLVQGPPQKSGQGPVVPSLIKYLQGPPQASGQGPVMPELTKQLQGPPQASGQVPVMAEQVGLFQGPRHPSSHEPSPVQDPLASANRPAATPMAVQAAVKQRSTADNATLLDEVVVEETLKAEFFGKAGIKTEIKSGQNILDGLSNDRIMKPADFALKTTNSASSETMKIGNMSGVPSRTLTPPMMLDLSRQMAGEAPLDSHQQSQQSATSTASATQQQSGQSGGNASGQQGRDAQQGFDSGTKNAGGERVAVYRLNVQQNGWADTMVRRLQTSLQNGTGVVRIILEPRNLGRLHVNLGLSEGRATIRIATDTTQAANLLRDSRAQLAQMFEQSGLRLSNMQTTTAVINGDGGSTADGSGSQMFADQQTSGHNANKDGKNSEHSNKLLSDSADASDIEIDTNTALAPGETAVLNVLA